MAVVFVGFIVPSSLVEVRLVRWVDGELRRHDVLVVPRSGIGFQLRTHLVAEKQYNNNNNNNNKQQTTTTEKKSQTVLTSERKANTVVKSSPL